MDNHTGRHTKLSNKYFHNYVGKSKMLYKNIEKKRKESRFIHNIWSYSFIRVHSKSLKLVNDHLKEIKIPENIWCNKIIWNFGKRLNI